MEKRTYFVMYTEGDILKREYIKALWCQIINGKMNFYNRKDTRDNLIKSIPISDLQYMDDLSDRKDL